MQGRVGFGGGQVGVWAIRALLLAFVVFILVLPFGNLGWPSFARAASAPPIQWSKTFGGLGNDGAYYVIQTGDGGYGLAGFYSTASNKHAFWFIKTDSVGTSQLSETYGGVIGLDDAYSVIGTSDGGYAMAGFTNSSGAGNYDGWLVKLDSSGNDQWNKTYGGTTADDLYIVSQTSDGGYVLVGYTTSFGAGAADSRLVKVDPSGNIIWNCTYGGAGADDTTSMTKTSDGGYALAGFTRSYGAGGTDFWLVKVASDGTLQWNMTYGGPGDDAARSVVQTNDGGYALAGVTSSYGSGGNDVWLVRADSLGNLQWSKTFGGIGIDDAVSLAKTNDGGFVLAGSTTSSGAGSSDVLVMRTDDLGNLVWTQTFGGSGADYAYSIIQTIDGGYAVAGDTSSFGASGTDVYFIKISPEAVDLSPTLNSTPTPSVIQSPDVSPTQWVTITPAFPTPTIPELSFLSILIAIIMVVFTFMIVNKRKLYKG